MTRSINMKQNIGGKLSSSGSLFSVDKNIVGMYKYSTSWLTGRSVMQGYGSSPCLARPLEVCGFAQCLR